MNPYGVYLETDPTGLTMGHVLSLPGCISLEERSDSANRRMGEAIVDYFIWLRRHGEKVRIPKKVQFEVVEHVHRGNMESGGEMALFTPERDPLPLEEIKRFLRLLNYSRIDFLSTLERVPPKEYDWSPNDGTRSFKSILKHVRNAERWYITRVCENFQFQRASPDPINSLFQSREDFIAFAKSLSREERHALYVPKKYPSGNRKEEWTARKVLRMALEHEREHTANVLQRLAQYRHSREGAPPPEPIGDYLLRLGMLR